MNGVVLGGGDAVVELLVGDARREPLLAGDALAFSAEEETTTVGSHRSDARTAGMA